MLLAQAIALHQAGRRTEADAAYRAVLAQDPGNARALHAHGVLRHQTGDNAGAVALITKAIAHHYPGAEAWFNLGLAQFRLGAFEDAAAAFGRAASLNPAWPEPHYDRGNALAAMGRHKEAADAFRAAVRLRPGYYQAEANLAHALKDSGQIAAAVAAYRRILLARPDLPEVHNNLATALRSLGDMRGAEAALREAVRLRPAFGEALGNLAALLRDDGRSEEAVPLAQAARTILPKDAAMAETLADCLRNTEKYEAALAAYRDALALEPGRRTARYGLAETARLAHDFASAEHGFRALLSEYPGEWNSHHDLANVLRDLGRFAEAETEYLTAIAIEETAISQAHLGATLCDQQKLPEALQTLQRAAQLQPGDANIEWFIATTQLTMGNFAEGFAHYESRLQKYKVPPLPGVEWHGEDPAGKTIFVIHEQGFGDTIQFFRYIPVLAARGARVIFRPQPALLELLRSAGGTAELIGPKDPVPAYDGYCRLLSLPHLLRRPEPIQATGPYLQARDADISSWRQRLAHLPGRRVGLAWAGNPTFTHDHLRSIDAATLEILATAPDISWVSLQKDAVAKPALPLYDAASELRDWADTAALISALDLVVCVDTGVAHLAGALGKDVWMLNRFNTCWRWLTTRQDSVWYPTLRVFRQANPGDWSKPLGDILEALAQPNS